MFLWASALRSGKLIKPEAFSRSRDKNLKPYLKLRSLKGWLNKGVSLLHSDLIFFATSGRGRKVNIKVWIDVSPLYTGNVHLPFEENQQFYFRFYVSPWNHRFLRRVCFVRQLNLIREFNGNWLPCCPRTWLEVGKSRWQRRTCWHCSCCWQNRQCVFPG